MGLSRPIRSIAIALVAALAVGTASAVTLVRLDELPALVEESRRAVLATVADVRYGFDEHRLHATFITLEVEDRLYGDHAPPAGGQLEIKIYGAPVELSNGTRMFIEGTPRYAAGDRLLLLLRDDSSHGFTNAPGLFAGVFRITTPDGGLWAESLAGNHVAFGDGGLARWLARDELTPAEAAHLETNDGPVPYGLLRKALITLWQEREGAR